MLYDFSELKEFVNTHFGVNSEEMESRFQIPNIDITLKEIKGDIDGSIIFIDSNGNKHKGFVYIGNYDSNEWDRKFGFGRMPKFHITICSTLIEQKNKGNYNDHYVFSNQPVKLVNSKFEEKDLILCKNCLKEQKNINELINTQQFVNNYLLKNFKEEDLPRQSKEIKIDMFGYTPDWDEKSKNYRIKKEFICENCGIQLNNVFTHGYYLETHHLNGDKTDNKESNLKCLCTLCHAFTNMTHQRNYKRQINKIKLIDFIELFGDKLKELNNPYINRIKELEL